MFKFCVRIVSKYTKKEKIKLTRRVFNTIYHKNDYYYYLERDKDAGSLKQTPPSFKLHVV